MSKITKAELKSKFTTGRVPTQQDFFDLIDSLVHLDDQTAVDQQVVNTKISAYDTALKARQPDGVINTLGDVYAAFEGYTDNRYINNELRWIGLPGKPTQLGIQWSEQTVVTDYTTYNPVQAGVAYQEKWLSSQVAGLTGQYTIVDLKTQRRWVPNSQDTGYFVDQIIAVKLAISPKVNT